MASTIIGEGIITLIFYGVAFGGMLETSSLIKGMIVAWAAKTLWEIIALPLTYKLVDYLKRAELIDYFDRDTDFNRFLSRQFPSPNHCRQVAHAPPRQWTANASGVSQSVRAEICQQGGHGG